MTSTIPEIEKSILELGLREASRGMDDILFASQGLMDLASIIHTIDHSSFDKVNYYYLLMSMGKHIQNLRNNVAERLEPVYQKHNVDPIGW